MTNDTVVEAAAWRIVYRLLSRDDYAEGAMDMKAAVNIEEPVFSEALHLLQKVNLIEKGEETSYEGTDVYKFNETHEASVDWGGTIMKVFPRVRKGGWPREDNERSSPPQPPAEGTKTHRVLDAFNVGEPITSKEISRRVYGREGKAVHSYISTLMDRGFVERIGKTGNLMRYQLTERGEEVVK